MTIRSMRAIHRLKEATNGAIWVLGSKTTLTLLKRGLKCLMENATSSKMKLIGLKRQTKDHSKIMKVLRETLSLSIKIKS